MGYRGKYFWDSVRIATREFSLTVSSTVGGSIITLGEGSFTQSSLLWMRHHVPRIPILYVDLQLLGERLSRTTGKNVEISCACDESEIPFQKLLDKASNHPQNPNWSATGI